MSEHKHVENPAMFSLRVPNFNEIDFQLMLSSSGRCSCPSPAAKRIKLNCSPNESIT